MKKLRLNSQVRKAFQGRSRGFTLIEVLIAIALLGIIGITTLGALSTASLALITADKRATAESLARSQMEFVKNQGYFDYSKPDHEDYDLIDGNPYTVEIVVQPIDLIDDLIGPGIGEPYLYNEGAFEGDDGIQQITVTVSRDGKVVITLEGYKRDSGGIEG